MSIIDFSQLSARKEAKTKEAEAYPYDTYFPDSVSFIGVVSQKVCNFRQI